VKAAITEGPWAFGLQAAKWRAGHRLLGVVVAGTLLGCSPTVTPLDPRNLERPVDMAFACYGDLAVDGKVVRSAQPVRNCTAGAPPVEGLSPAEPALHGFVLQNESGTVALLQLNLGTSAGTVLDSDPLVPGKNAIPVGTLPVAIAADPAGCHMVVANSGSCDMAVVDVGKAIAREPSVVRQSVVNASGELIAARPAAMVGQPAAEPAAAACPAAPPGLNYVAYPRCNLVAVVRADSGEVVAGVRFPEVGPPEITDGNVTCPAECGAFDPDATADAGMPADAGPAVDAGPMADAGPGPVADTAGARPVAVTLASDGRTLFVGADNAAMVAAVELGESGLPVAVRTVPLEGDVGVTALTATGPVPMGGERSRQGTGVFGTFSYVYAIATDRSIRVVEVEREVECDTQVDPRFLHDVRDGAALACLEVGAATTPPRRAGATSPGIVLPGGRLPLDVASFVTDQAGDMLPAAPNPSTLVGHFVLASATDGQGYIINVDDDIYPDFENLADPSEVYMPLAIAHQLRDRVTSREKVVGDTCSVEANAELSAGAFGPRAQFGVAATLNADVISQNRSSWLPRGRQVECEIAVSDGSGGFVVADRAPVSELNIAAPPLVREAAFPDLAAVKNEEFLLVWEGRLSLDDRSFHVDGPSVRFGVIERDGAQAQLVDGSAPFCTAGVEPFDIVQLLGCQGDQQCGLGEECVVHPETPSSVSLGLCLPVGAGLEDQCRDLLVSRKQYSAVETFAGHLRLAERRRVLRTTPLDGCTADTECEQLARLEPFLRTDEPPSAVADLSSLPPSEFTWACVADPGRAPGPNRCVMTCGDSSDCEPGRVCSDGVCVDGPLPPAECVPTIQRYELRAGDAFAVVGAPTSSRFATGYLHSRVADPVTGECVADPSANPLQVGRISLRVPDCAGDADTDLAPNPCMTTIDDVIVEEFAFENGQCVAVPPPRDGVLNDYETRQVQAIRFRNPVVTMHLVQPSTVGDRQCPGDQMGGLPAFSPVYQGYALSFRVVGGFVPQTVALQSARPATIVPGPDGGLWVLDEGDVVAGTATRGRVIRVDPVRLPDLGSSAEASIIF
jgi:hypothetical protein